MPDELSDEVGSMIHTVLDSERCADCGRSPVPEEAAFCPFCGKRLPQLEVLGADYRHPTAVWMVTTDETPNNPGGRLVALREGRLDMVVREFSGHAGDLLVVRPGPPVSPTRPTRRIVHVRLGNAQDLCRLDRASRARIVSIWLKQGHADDVQVIESELPGAVALTWKGE